MELYKLIATINNTNPATVFTFAWIPENFEGVKISQKFSFVNPIGYTPKFSIETMRIIESDKTTIDEIFLQYGLESDVEIEILKLNATGTDHEALPNSPLFAIDFESYEIFDEYSEFALKSVSAIDDYNKVKNTEIQVDLTEETNLPTTQKFINYVSLKKSSFNKGTEQSYCFFCFEKNNESKIYNGDTSIYTPLVAGYNTIPNGDIYRFGENTELGTKEIKFTSSGSLKFNLAGGIGGNIDLSLKMYKNDFVNPVYTFFDNSVPNGLYSIDLNLNLQSINGNYLKNDVFFIAASVSSYIPDNLVFEITSGDFFIDIKRITDIEVVDVNNSTINFQSISNALNTIFNNKITIPADAIYDYGLTSANQISKLSDFANIKPKEFLSDLCVMAGLMLNFKIDGTVEIGSITTMFNSLLNASNAVAITDYKDLSVKHNLELNFASVSVGHEINEYDMYSYLLDWNKILTFSQANRNASENLDLTLQKLRTDFSGMLDYFYKRSKQQQKTSKDNFIFNPAFPTDSSIFDIAMYDGFTPRYMLSNWIKFLSFCFQNYGKNTLTISSNGGNNDDLEHRYLTEHGEYNVISEMSDFIINSTPRLLPVEYNFTALIPDIDFSENILKINHNNEDVYLFVIDAETMDNLSEQKIKGLKIQF